MKYELRVCTFALSISIVIIVNSGSLFPLKSLKLLKFLGLRTSLRDREALGLTFSIEKAKYLPATTHHIEHTIFFWKTWLPLMICGGLYAR